MLHFLKMTKSTWRTAEGRTIPVKSMESSHLRASIRFLRENAFPLKMKATTKAELKRNLAMSDDAFLLKNVPPFETMVLEAAERRLFRVRE